MAVVSSCHSTKARKESKAFARRLELRKGRRKEALGMGIADSRLPLDLAGNIANWRVSAGDTEDWM